MFFGKGAHLKPFSVLVVDDGIIDREVIKRHLLKEFPATLIIESENGQRAMEILTQPEPQKELYGEFFPPTFIFLDINMPLMNGWQFLEKFKSLRETHNYKTQILFMFSSSDLEDDRKKALEYDFVEGYLVKGKYGRTEIRELILTTGQKIGLC